MPEHLGGFPHTSFWQMVVGFFVSLGALGAGGRGLVKLAQLETKVNNIQEGCPAVHSPLAARIQDLEHGEKENQKSRILLARIEERVEEHGKKLDQILDRLS